MSQLDTQPKDNALLQEEPQISDVLYKRASEDNKGLSKLECILLFSRCDLTGKVLAGGAESLTETQRNMLLLRPPPDVMARNIKEVTDGAMSSLAELMAADVLTLYDRVLVCAVGDYWTDNTSHLLKAMIDASQALPHCSYDVLGKKVPHEWARRMILSREEREFNSDVLRAWGLHKAPDAKDGIKNSNKGVQSDPVPEDVKAAQAEEARAAYVAERERLRQEMRAELAAKLAALTDDERARLRELVRAEQELSKREADEDAAARAREMQEEVEEKEKWDRLDKEERAKERRQERREKVERLKAKERRLGIGGDDDDDGDDDGDDGMDDDDDDDDDDYDSEYSDEGGIRVPDV